MRNKLVISELRTIFVPEAGLEPARPEEHRILSPACLPIPPLGQLMKNELFEMKRASSNSLLQKKSLQILKT